MQKGPSATEDALFAEKERAEVTLNSIGDAVVCTDALGRTTFLNIVAERLTGWPREEAIGRPVTDILRLLEGKSRTPIEDPLQLAILGDKPIYLPPNVVLVHRDGSHIPIEDTVAPIHDRTGQVTGAVIVFRDVTAARVMALQLAYSANHDALTGLPNRLLLLDRIGQAIGMAARHGKRLAILFLDLDRFKHINDSLGHSIGDRLLVSIAERLAQSIRDTDTVSRQGGDEFVLLLSEVGGIERLALTAKRILKAVASVHAIDQHGLRITTSIGISVYPDDGLDAETLIKNADTAMYQAKEHGRQGFRFFESSMNAAPWSASRSRRPCGAHSNAANSNSTTSRRSTSGQARSRARKPSCAGTTRLWDHCCPGSSLPLRKKAASYSRSAVGSFLRRAGRWWSGSAWACRPSVSP